MINELLLKVHPSWQQLIIEEQKKPYFLKLNTFLTTTFLNNKEVYPPKNFIFNALTYPVLQTKVLILGQDPYHQPGQAHGLAFSVLPGIKTPPSLRNILKELANSIPNIDINGNCLNPWANQGVMLLNTLLTVNKNEPLSHANQGWEQFTQAIITYLSAQNPYLVCLLWGNNAQNNAHFIHAKHAILKAAHPSPLSASRGFMGCNHFNLCNQLLVKNNITPINWAVPILA